MSKVLAIFGATGRQGGSALRFVKHDAELNEEYQIRAITRNPFSHKAQRLRSEYQVEVVLGDLNSRVSLEAVLHGVHTIFLVTNPSLDSAAPDREYEQAKLVADIAVEQGVSLLIYSSGASMHHLTQGRLPATGLTEAKARAQTYISGLTQLQSAFIWPGSFMSNFAGMPGQRPVPMGDGTYELRRNVSGDLRWPVIDADANIGNFVGAVLADPQTFYGKTLAAAAGLYSLRDIAANLSRSSGKRVVYRQVSDETLAEFLPPALADRFIQIFKYIEEVGGTFGPDTDRLVEWSVANARGQLSTFEGYLELYPVQLD